MSVTDDIEPSCIVALVDEEGEFDHVWRTALRLAEEHGARLVLYDGQSAALFSEPMPTPVSAEGAGEQFGDPLTDDELERLGRPSLAEQVRSARRAGVEAAGKLATEGGMEPLMRYAAEQGAGLVVLPAELRDPSFLERLRGQTLGAAEGSSAVPIVVVDRAGNLG